MKHFISLPPHRGHTSPSAFLLMSYAYAHVRRGGPPASPPIVDSDDAEASMFNIQYVRVALACLRFDGIAAATDTSYMCIVILIIDIAMRVVCSFCYTLIIFMFRQPTSRPRIFIYHYRSATRN
ncbi:hypothetical protein BOTBODRAFT_35298, partial [Botryobasidium botryosum FD-172 SS1]